MVVSEGVSTKSKKDKIGCRLVISEE